MSRRSRSRSGTSRSNSRRSSSGSSGSSGSAAESTPAVRVVATPAQRAPDGTGYDELRDLAVGIAQQAAGLIRRLRAEGVAISDTKTSEVDIVTEIDRASQDLVVDLLRRLRPDDAILAEEGVDAPGASGVRWVLDPVDGTVNLLYGIDAYAVSLAAEVSDGTRNVPVAGVVVDVVAGDVYEAYAQGGARRNGAVVHVRDAAPLAQRLIRTGFSYDAHRRGLQGAAVAALLPRVRDVRRIGSCALDLCAVAAGESDGYVEEGIQLWDRAAGGLIAAEAGARVEILDGIGGAELVLAAPAHGFAELAQAVRDAGFLAGRDEQRESVPEPAPEPSPEATRNDGESLASVGEPATAAAPESAEEPTGSEPE